MLFNTFSPTDINLVMVCILVRYSLVLFYADNIALLACSCYGLQQLINICYKYGMQRDIRFNPQKSQLACFGGNSPPDNINVFYCSCFIREY